MITTAKRGIHKPKAFMSTIVSCIEIEPSSIKQALAQLPWFESIQFEFNTLLKNKTWVLVPPPPNQTVIGSKWLF